MGVSCVCDPAVVDGYRYVEWIASWAGECVHTPREIQAFACGIAALFCFLVGLLPQMYKNYKRGDVEGLSFALLCIWAMGDVTNLIGAIMTRQTFAMKLCGTYFVFLSIASFVQYFHYKKTNDASGAGRAAIRAADEEIATKPAGDDPDRTATETDPLLHQIPIPHQSSSQPRSAQRHYAGGRSHVPTVLERVTATTALILALAAVFASVEAAPTSEMLMMRGDQPDGTAPILPPPSCDGQDKLQDPWVAHTGEVIAWISGLMYFSSRIPQLIENHRTKSTEALSLYVFSLTIIGNILYCGSIVLRLPHSTTPALDSNFFAAVLPYLLGSAGTLVFDLAIFAQAAYYGCL
ncbi:PQ loop repeat-domain-containing protein [Fimicolochytrium jonesii]|uniref:PQ loop repeat-domain-containing protein n=1 Tax=Fimicolochytrium jonesii TaxID=1396493 RepID=UPI0022FF442A|nr:PQ loop repeat-domain-containing protein [Fimicolochytrium jonesii]KAI8824202.1 PQ loop repeat-domain-containing protein [Fimicolochytrium jonesii]